MNELSNMISGFRRRHPFITFDIYSGNAEGIKARIESGALDMGLLIEPVDTAKYEFIRLHTKETWGVLVRDDSALAAKQSVAPEDLVNYPLLVPANRPVQNELSSWFGDYAKQMNIISTHNLVYNSAVMVQNGVGVTVTLKLDCHYDHLRFIPLQNGLELSSVLAWKDSQVFSPATTAFIDYVKKYSKGIE